jgi:hypothetical protein
MGKIDMAALRTAFKKNEQSNSAGQNNYYPFYNMDMGASAEVRFLPDRNDENPMGFLIEKKMHQLVINGEKKSIVCPKTWGIHEVCPICKLSSAYYKKDDKDNGKIYYRKLQYICQALIVSDPLPKDKDTGLNHEGKTRYLALGNQLYDVIKDSFESGYLQEPPFLYVGGTNFTIKKTEKMLPDKRKVAAYHMSRFVPLASDLDEETLAHVMSSLIDLSTLLPKRPDVDKIEAMLEASLKGEPLKVGDDASDASPDVDDAPVQVVTSVKEAAVASTTVKETVKDIEKPAPAATGEQDPEARRILEGLAARRKQQQSANKAA